jgi:flagellar protein FliS
MEQGGELAQNLRGMYDYSILRLTHANLRNDDAALVEVSALIEPVADSWKQIKASGYASAPAASAGLMGA